MKLHRALILGAPPVAVAVLATGYLFWLSWDTHETLSDPSELPILCEPSTAGAGAILPVTEAEHVYDWRCQQANDTVVSTWVPSADDVRALERSLPAFWATQLHRRQPRPLDSYVRQYAGFVANGRKSICVNFVDISTLEADAYLYRHDRGLRAALPRGVCPEDYWRHMAIVATDGGVLYCGVAYDLASDSFMGLSCNGL